ncbi:hypothetical protein [Actinomadura decatromicini]|uniref:Fibronectin type-III domain-containing protein n=1 Tax=Actinomadura decatromicini TaxID=2604572 RepID=A0A5D3FUI7_9ACTN|nr:hypothetical protein [Actinomadura decatromicini]TYK50785.1 hypothetical protein FXF68_09930 [Actinomadura decatromicini]
MSLPLLAMPAQAASTSVITPAAGSVITSGSELTAKAHFDFALTMQLWVDGPGIGSRVLQEKGLVGDLSGTFPISRNGTYRVYLKGKQTSHVYDSNTFTVRIAPAAPTGVSAQASGSKLVVSWNRGLEDDLTGYALSGSGVKSTSGSIGSLCKGTSCSASLSVTRSSGPVSVGVRARRSTGTGGSLYSGAASASALVGGGPASLPEGSAPSLPSGSGVPGTGAPLTPFNGDSPVTLPSVRPNGATPGIAYPAPEIATESPRTQNVAATDRLQWGKSVGIALVLLIAAAHLGTWTRRLRVAQAGTSSKGTAARLARGGTGRKRVRRAREQIARAEARAKAAPVMPLVDKPDQSGEPEKPGESEKAGESEKRSEKGSAPASGTATLVDAAAAGKVAGAVRRPATLGKRSGGVNVRLAKSGPSKSSKRAHRRK